MRRVVCFTNPKGMHLRPSSALAKLTRTLQAKVEIIAADGSRVDTKDILQVLSLGMGPGNITFEAEGPEAEEALNAVEELLTNFRLD